MEHIVIQDSAEEPCLAGAEPVAVHASERPRGAEKITETTRIAGLLKCAMNRHLLLSVQIPRVKERYNSAILEVEPAEQSLVLDELKPKDGHQRLLDARRLRVNTRLGGVELDFETSFESFGKKDGIFFYRVALPETLYYRQRRAHYRGKVSMARPVSVTLFWSDGEELRGHVNDISLGGLGLRFSGPLPSRMQVGARIPGCALRLPTGDALSCEVEVRHVGVAVRANAHMVGVRFLRLSAAQEKSIAGYVAMLNRELIRKMQRARNE